MLKINNRRTLPIRPASSPPYQDFQPILRQSKQEHVFLLRIFIMMTMYATAVERVKSVVVTVERPERERRTTRWVCFGLTHNSVESLHSLKVSSIRAKWLLLIQELLRVRSPYTKAKNALIDANRLTRVHKTASKQAMGQQIHENQRSKL